MKLRILKIELEVSYLILCIFSIIIISGKATNLLWCFLSIIIHEIGHIIPMFIFGFRPEKINISLFEISITDTSRLKRSFWQNFFIILFGPFVNFICFILFYLLYLYGNDFFLPFSATNLFVGLFNFLPVLSLDGGQLLYIILCRKLTEHNSERIVDIFTFIFIFPLSALGFLVLLKSKYNFSLLFVCVYLIFSLILKNNRYY